MNWAKQKMERNIADKFLPLPTSFPPTDCVILSPDSLPTSSFFLSQVMQLPSNSLSLIEVHWRVAATLVTQVLYSSPSFLASLPFCFTDYALNSCFPNKDGHLIWDFFPIESQLRSLILVTERDSATPECVL